MCITLYLFYAQTVYIGSNYLLIYVGDYENDFLLPIKRKNGIFKSPRRSFDVLFSNLCLFNAF